MGHNAAVFAGAAMPDVEGTIWRSVVVGAKDCGRDLKNIGESTLLCSSLKWSRCVAEAHAFIVDVRMYDLLVDRTRVWIERHDTKPRRFIIGGDRAEMKLHLKATKFNVVECNGFGLDTESIGVPVEADVSEFRIDLQNVVVNISTGWDF
ncbi:MAG: hypothetical protein DHS20C16_11230 [Phycisphaerae bacterium]|nr:MAG: hypothetical protein DHS20C16_11230 [Phycisphaerae bacterium]